ncbi:MAG TPA: ABC transporter permease, partial [Vicinamibacterales bacterium]|nr:ABC transporter permease [Vicinamibacterales bacterium]
MTTLRLAFRTLRRTPVVTLVAVVSLALGMGATTAIFATFHRVLLQPLPVPEPDRLVNLSAPGPKPGWISCNQTGSCEEVFSYPMFRDLERVQQVFTGIAAHRSFGANLAWHGETTSGEGVYVSGSYFPVLGLRPAVGRLFDPRDDRAPGEPRAVVLSHAYWTSRFGGNPGVLGDTLVVNGQPLAIVGVAPRGFEGTTLGMRPQVFVPVTLRQVLEPRWRGFDDRRN